MSIASIFRSHPGYDLRKAAVDIGNLARDAAGQIRQQKG
jgi:hypothetical protein